MRSKHVPSPLILSLWKVYGRSIHKARTSGDRYHGWGVAATRSKLGCTLNQARSLIRWIDEHGSEPPLEHLRQEYTLRATEEMVILSNSLKEAETTIEQLREQITTLNSRIDAIQRKIDNYNVSRTDMDMVVSNIDFQQLSTLSKGKR